MTELAYAGLELELFAGARRWKGYWTDLVRPALAGEVLEVGAGLGANTPLLRSSGVRRWVCLEPDPRLAARLRTAVGSGPGGCRVIVGTLADLPAGERFDAVVYADVLEHIADDRAELARAAGRLRPGGRLIVLAPAHPWLFSPFDAAIGHHRRYRRSDLAAAAPATLALERLVALDAAGLVASAANRLLLRTAAPSARQIALWDGLLVPVSRRLDPLLGYRVGKSLLAIWRRR